MPPQALSTSYCPSITVHTGRIHRSLRCVGKDEASVEPLRPRAGLGPGATRVETASDRSPAVSKCARLPFSAFLRSPDGKEDSEGCKR